MLETSRTRATWPKVDADPMLIDAAPDPVSQEIAERYEHIYQNASGDPSCLPWYHRGANHALVDWLNADAHRLVRPGARTIVVGCGLGDDVIELAHRGYDACGFDISGTCVDWARRRFEDEADRFFHADAMCPPSRLRARFDLVIEAFTIQSVLPDLRERVFQGIASLAKPHGVIVILARSHDEAESLHDCECAPYPICRTELIERMEERGFSPVRDPNECTDDDEPPHPCLLAAFRRS